MAGNRRITTVRFEENGQWANVHEDYTQPFERLYYVNLPGPQDGSKIVEDMGATATALQGVLGDAISSGKQLRCLGGGWSLSNTPIVSPENRANVWLLSTTAMNLYWTMESRQVNAAYKKDITGLYLAQCGVSIQDLNDTVEGDGKSLITSGASNGQTIAGAMATGTHGSAFQFGSIPEYVVGIHLITLPDKVIWLERATYPVISDEFAGELGAQLVRDDDLFNAVLVSFGSMGIIAGVMIETVPKYLFEAQQMRIGVTQDLQNAMNSMTFANLPLPYPDETPWHFDITFNPHDMKGGGYVRTLYKRPFPANGLYQKCVTPPGCLSPGASLLSVMGSITDVLPPIGIDVFMNKFVSGNLQAYGPCFGTSGEIFTTTVFPRGKAMSMELGIAMENSADVLTMLLSLPEISVYAGIISYRWVKQTTGMLGWTKFPITATVEFNAAYNDRTLAFYNQIWNALTIKKIPYTLHWGQMNNFTPELVRKMYGATVDKWLSCRDRLLDNATKSVLSSDFLKSTGLDYVPPPVAPSIV